MEATDGALRKVYVSRTPGFGKSVLSAVSLHGVNRHGIFGLYQTDSIVPAGRMESGEVFCAGSSHKDSCQLSGAGGQCNMVRL